MTTPSLTVVFTERAAQEAEAAEAWWRENRLAAPGLFSEELERRMALVAATPHLGVVVRNVRAHEVRRILLARVGYHVYYRVEIQLARVLVLSVWHAQRAMPFLL
jgi:plasmid stabilization system protein ParE